MARSLRPKGLLFWPLLAVVIAGDLLTKLLAVAYLSPQHVPHQVLGHFVQLTLAYNPGASFGFHVGEHSRIFFILLSSGALAVLGRMYHVSTPADQGRVAALALICGGALGNLLDRIRSPLGVVDFIDLGIGPHQRWYTFNVADIGITCGAMLLAWVLWREDSAAVPAIERARTTASADTGLAG